MFAFPGNSRLSPALALVPGILYESVVRIRNRLYDQSLRPQKRLSHPVISIGNLTMGGSGKTPLVIYLAGMIARMNYTPVLLSRGYGRLARCPRIVAPGENVAEPAQDLGDEPAFIRRQEPSVWLGISPDRYGMGVEIARRATNPVFVLDDGFQHRCLQRDLDVLVIDRTQALEVNRMFPRGSLREPISGMRRADIIMINGVLADTSDPVESVIRRTKPDASTFHCVQKIVCLKEYSQWGQHAHWEASGADVSSVYLVAAIGNPARFLDDVRQYGAEVKGAHFFRDHCRVHADCWNECAEAARRSGAAAILTTEKDAIKLSRAPDYPLLVAIQSMQVREGNELERIVRSVIEAES